MALHFSTDEFAERQARTCRALENAGLDGIILFRQESMFYLTGYDTSGYTMFQGMYFGADGAMALLTRSADRLQSAMTSVLEDIRNRVKAGEDLSSAFEAHGEMFPRLYPSTLKAGEKSAFKAEVRLLQGLNHDYVIDVHELIHSSQRIYSCVAGNRVELSLELGAGATLVAFDPVF